MEKADQELWLQGYTTDLARRYRPYFLNDFQYTTLLAQDLTKPCPTTPRTDSNWWWGIVGAQLARTQDKIQSL